MEPRIRVSAILRWQGRVLLCRQEKPGKEYWLLPGGGVDVGETLIEALRRELREELAIEADVQFEGPVALVDSIAPRSVLTRRHIVHIIFAADLSHRSLNDVETRDAAVKGARLFSREELEDVDGAPADQAVPRTLAAGRPGRLPRRPLGASARSGRRANGHAPPRRRALRARADPASGASSAGSPPVACASASASTRSANHGLRGSSGPCRYVP